MGKNINKGEQDISAGGDVHCKWNKGEYNIIYMIEKGEQ
jgi:hypothetical protein